MALVLLVCWSCCFSLSKEVLRLAARDVGLDVVGEVGLLAARNWWKCKSAAIFCISLVNIVPNISGFNLESKKREYIFFCGRQILCSVFVWLIGCMIKGPLSKLIIAMQFA